MTPWGERAVYEPFTYNEDGTISATYPLHCKAWNVSSIVTVKSWLDQLEAQGYIERRSSSRITSIVGTNV